MVLNSVAVLISKFVFGKTFLERAAPLSANGSQLNAVADLEHETINIR